MSKALQQLKHSIDSWASEARDLGMFSTSTYTDISTIGVATPASLFDSGERPLVIGFFGGTGVGKSTLLNRLAGEQIARTSVERPTSREVTLYLHSTINVTQLPDSFPVDKINVATHNREEHRHLLWIDMPDFDSVEEDNRALVQSWLPHIDLLVYVVSPERYKDDNGWRLLLSHGHRHAWLFVINHWDRGSEVQRQDFSTQLAEAGLPDPVIFCTDCSQTVKGALAAAVRTNDDFDALESTIQSMADTNTIKQLEARGVTVRTTEMQQAVEQAIASMGEPRGFDQLTEQWQTRWKEQSDGILNAVKWRFPLMAQHYATNEPGLLKGLINTLRGKEQQPTQQTALAGLGDSKVFDDESILRVADDIDDVVQRSVDHQIPPGLIKHYLEPVKSDIGRAINRQANESLKASLSRPGTGLQRFFHRFFGLLATVLPLLAMGWVGYRIVNGFYQGGTEPGSYLGTTFAVNGLLLVGVAWLAPYFARLKTRPALEKAAMRGMQTGAEKGLGHVRAEVTEALARAKEHHGRTIEIGSAFFDKSPTTDSTPAVSGMLDRTLPRKLSTKTVH